MGKITKLGSFLHFPVGGASRPEQLGCWLWSIEKEENKRKHQEKLFS